MSYKVSHSEVDTFRSCQRRHFYAYGMKIEPAPGPFSIGKALYRGIIGHTGLAEYFIAVSEKLSEQEIIERAIGGVEISKNVRGKVDQPIVSEVIDLIFQFHRYRFAEVSQWQILEVENETVYEIIPQELSTVILPDLVARIPGKGYTVIDHKFKYDFLRHAELALLPQLPKYTVGLRGRFPLIRHAMYNVLRYRHLKEPTNDDLFQFQWIDLSATRAVQTFREHIATSETIKIHRDSGLETWESNITRNPGDQCSWCDFAMLCEGDINNQPRELMVDMEYQPRTRRSNREQKVAAA